MRLKFIPFLLVIGLISFASCATNNVEEILTSCETESQSFAADIQPIFISNCATPGCHLGATPAGGTELNTFALIKSRVDAGRVQDRINNASNPMPPFGLMADCDRNKINSWINDGALEN